MRAILYFALKLPYAVRLLIMRDLWSGSNDLAIMVSYTTLSPYSTTKPQSSLVHI